MRLEVEEFYSEGEEDAVSVFLQAEDYCMCIEGWLDDYTTWEISWIQFDLKSVPGVDFWWEFENLDIPIEVGPLLNLPVTRHTWMEA
jgi:hypothetical protein